MTSMVVLMIFIAHSLFLCLVNSQPFVEGKPYQLALLIAAMASTGRYQGQVHLC